MFTPSPTEGCAHRVHAAASTFGGPHCCSTSCAHSSKGKEIVKTRPRNVKILTLRGLDASPFAGLRTATALTGPDGLLKAITATVLETALEEEMTVRDGQVGNQPFYAAIGGDLNGRRDVLGLWAGQGGWGEREVLDERADRPEEPGRAGRFLRRL